jgi:Protein of unknown function (DUF664)
MAYLSSHIPVPVGDATNLEHMLAASDTLSGMDYTDLHPVPECLIGSEGEMLCFALDRVRAQFAWKTGRLDADQLRQRHPPSSMTLAGLIKHMALVEDGFTAGAHEREVGPPWNTMDWPATVRWAWDSAVTDEPETLYALWYGAVGRSRTAWTEMVRGGGLETHVGSGDWMRNRRRFLIDLLEEYLKHTGHADLLREAVDGLVGNDPVEADGA